MVHLHSPYQTGGDVYVGSAMAVITIKLEITSNKGKPV